MAHLHCGHARRVMVIPAPAGPVTLHRSDGSHCDAPLLAIGNTIVPPREVLTWKEA